jgi:hypothetical protein
VCRETVCTFLTKFMLVRKPVLYLCILCVKYYLKDVCAHNVNLCIRLDVVHVGMHVCA